MRLVILCLALLTASPCAAAEKITDPHEKQVVRDCTWDALRYCKSAIPQGRSTIISCMLDHRDKLQQRCSRHLY